ADDPALAGVSGQAGGEPGEGLDGPGRGAVLLGVVAGDGDGVAVGCGQLGGQPGRVIAGDRQPGAVLGAVGGEGGQDDRTAAGQGGAHRGQVGGAVGGADEEVEDGPVMPDLVRPGRLPGQQVGVDPADAAAAWASAADC